MNILPDLALNDFRDSARTHAIYSGEVFNRPYQSFSLHVVQSLVKASRPRYIFFANLPYLLFGKLCIVGFRSKIMAQFISHIAQILGFSSKEEMIRIDTRRYVAVMADAHSIRDDSEMQFPRNTVSILSMPNRFIYRDAPITKGGSASRPQPAGFSDVYMPKKAHLQWNRLSHGFILASGVHSCH